MNCIGCNAESPPATLFRVNDKGRPGLFACEKCVPPNVDRPAWLLALIHTLESRDD